MLLPQPVTQLFSGPTTFFLMWNSPEPYDFFLSGINSLAGISVSTLLAIYIALLIMEKMQRNFQKNFIGIK